MIMITLNQIKAHNPCASGWHTILAAHNKTDGDDVPFPLADALTSNGVNDILWAMRCLPEHNNLWRKYAVWCARQVQHLMTDPRSIAALDAAWRHSEGTASDDELTAAAADAADATDAADAADAAARAAADAAAAAADADADADAAYAAYAAADAAARAAYAADAAAYAAAAYAAYADAADADAAADAAAYAAYAADAAAAYADTACEKQKTKLRQILTLGVWTDNPEENIKC